MPELTAENINRAFETMYNDGETPTEVRLTEDQWHRLKYRSEPWTPPIGFQSEFGYCKIVIVLDPEDATVKDA